MTRVTDLDINPDLKDSMLKGVNVKDRRTNVCIETKNIVWRKRNLKNFIADTPLDPVAVLWNNLSDADKALWNTAASHCGMTGYRLFVQDITYRIENSLPGVATPNNNHQYKVMKPSKVINEYILYALQVHDSSYQLKQYRSGSKLAYDWVEIEEVFAPPLKLEFDYYSDLINPYGYYSWTVRIRFNGTKDGSPVQEDITFDLDLQTGWTRWSEILSPDMDEISYYYVRFYGYHVSGTAYFDNINMEHGGQNYAINPNCDRANEVFYIRSNLVYSAWQALMWDHKYLADSVYID